MGNSSSSDNKAEDVGEINNSSGFHLLELHLPSVSFSFGITVIVILVLAAIYYCCRQQSKRKRQFQMMQMQYPLMHLPVQQQLQPMHFQMQPQLQYGIQRALAPYLYAQPNVDPAPPIRPQRFVPQNQEERLQVLDDEV